jgi:SPP1 family predicted phage head-tail adaptor
MMWRDIAELVELIDVPDSVGGYTTSEMSRTVFCNKKSVRYDEFYKAHAVGLEPKMNLVVRTVDYNDESRVRYEGKLYDILRTHSKNGETVELTCAKRTEVM